MSDVYKGLFNEPVRHPWVSPTAGNGSSLVVLVLEMFQESPSDSVIATNG